MVSEGCILNGVTARNSIFGLRSRIDRGAKIESSIVMGADYFESIEDIRHNSERQVPHLGIGENTIVRRAIIDKNARIGNNVQLINKDNVENRDDENGCYYIRDRIVIIPKNSIIHDGTII